MRTDAKWAYLKTSYEITERNRKTCLVKGALIQAEAERAGA